MDEYEANCCWCDGEIEEFPGFFYEGQWCYPECPACHEYALRRGLVYTVHTFGTLIVPVEMML